MSEMSATIGAALQATEGEDSAVRAAAAGGAAASLGTSLDRVRDKDVGWLWKVLVSGLIAVLLISLGGVIWTIIDGDEGTTPDVIVTIFSSALAGLLGLFVRSPA